MWAGSHCSSSANHRSHKELHHASVVPKHSLERPIASVNASLCSRTRRDSTGQGPSGAKPSAFMKGSTKHLKRACTSKATYFQPCSSYNSTVHKGHIALKDCQCTRDCRSSCKIPGTCGCKCGSWSRLEGLPLGTLRQGQRLPKKIRARSSPPRPPLAPMEKLRAWHPL